MMPEAVYEIGPDSLQDRKAFLSALHPVGFRDMRAIAPKGQKVINDSYPADDLSAVNSFAECHSSWNVYVGVAPRKNRTERGADGCAGLYAVFADIDFKESSEVEARARLDAFALRPSMIVNTGGGLHVYWLLTEAIDVATAKRLLRAVAEAVGADKRSAEPAHVLRLPGTLNQKYAPPRPVFLEARTENRYSLRQFTDLVTLAPESLDRDTTPVEHGLDRDARKKKAQQWLERQPAGYEQGYRPDDPIQAGDDETFKVCCAIVRDHDLNEDDALEVLQAWNARCDPPWPASDLLKKIASASRNAKGASGSKLVQSFPLTNAGDAEYFAARYDGKVCFDARQNRWLLAEETSGLWLPDPVEQLRSYGVDAMRARQRDANTINDLERRKQAWKWAVDGESTTRLNNLIREARTQPSIRNDSLRDPWDSHGRLLGVPGGVVDLRTGEMRKARPEERITMRAGADYDPTARSPLWENALREISDDDPAWVSYLQRLGGYTTTGDTSQDKWFIKHGKNGREGKGTIDGGWAAALGDYSLELPAAVFELRPKGNPDFDLSYLPSRRFVLSSESGNTVHLHHDRIKQMTGGGSMRVANKHEKSFEFVPACKLWLACNDLPTVTDDSSAFWARVIVLPFRRSFLGKEDTSLRPKLSNDPSHRRAILAWLIKGAIDYYRDGLGQMPSSIETATKAFRDIAWPLTPFVTEDCIVDPELEVSVSDFNQGYQRFCDQQGVGADRRLGWKRVLKLMEARFKTRPVDGVTSEGVRVREKRYVGIGLRVAVPAQQAFKEGDEESPF